MLRTAVALTVVLALSGCSLVNPYVVGSRTREDPETRQIVVVAGKTDLVAALAYAARVKDEYRGALSDQARLQAWLGIGLIALSAAALGLGATGAPAEWILGLGLTGAAGFGTATWLLNRPRQAAYVAGIKAVTCAEAAVTPLVPLNAASLETDLGTLSDQIPVVERQIAVVAATVDRFEAVLAGLSATGRLAAPEHDDLLRDAKAELAATRSLVSSAETAYSSGADVASLVRSAGERLRVAIENIVATVDGIIVETQRDPQALTAIISGLGGTYKTLSTVPEALKGVRDEAARRFEAEGDVDAQVRAQRDQETLNALKPLNERLAGELRTLRQESGRLSAARRKVAVVVNMVTRDAPVKALEGCGVKATDVVTALTIDPSPPFELGKSAALGFVVKGGVPPYWASVKGPGDGVTVVPVPGSSSAFNLTVGKDAPAGSYVLNVIDSVQGAKTGQVTVKDGAPAPPAPPVKPPTPSPTAAQVEALLKETKGKPFVVAGVTVKVGDVKLEQGKAVVSATVESTSQPRLEAFTQEAVVKALLDKSASGLKETQVTIKEFDKLRSDAAPRAKIGAACASVRVEKPVKSDAEPLFPKPKPDGEKLQRALCHKKGDKTKDVDGIWGPETKHSLRLYQCHTGREPDGKLTDKLVEELLSLGAEAITQQCPLAK